MMRFSLAVRLIAVVALTLLTAAPAFADQSSTGFTKSPRRPLQTVPDVAT